MLKEGDTIEAKFTGVDRKTRQITLSIKAKDSEEEQEAMRELTRQEGASPTLGDLFKEKMETKDK